MLFYLFMSVRPSVCPSFCRIAGKRNSLAGIVFVIISVLKLGFNKNLELKFVNLAFTSLLRLVSASPLGELVLVRQRLLLGLCLSVGFPFWISLPGCAGHLHAAVSVSGDERLTGEDA